MLEDKTGNIWFGSDGKGISMLKSETAHTSNPSFVQITEKDKLGSSTIRSIRQDKNGNIWIATGLGLNYLVKAKDGEQMLYYTTADGLKANDFIVNSVYIDKKDHIWWGNGKALTNLDLNNYKFPESVPAIQ